MGGCLLYKKYIFNVKLFPLFINISRKPCLVVGGGVVGTRKVTTLLSAGADVTVVSRNLTDELEELKRLGKITHRAGDFSPEYVEGMLLCISAVDDPAVNHLVARCSREAGVPVNVVDQPELCDFYFPSIVSRGDLTIALSSGGVSPALIKRLRQEMEKHYGPEYAGVLKIMGFLREKLKGAGITGDRLARLLGDIAALPLAQAIREGKLRELSIQIDGVLASGKDKPAVDMGTVDWAQIVSEGVSDE
jgi:precorrin-2 dehydrogenase/sirohydrochlorin ferrochelatase